MFFSKRCGDCGKRIPGGMAYQSADGSFLCQSCYFKRQDKWIKLFQNKQETAKQKSPAAAPPPKTPPKEWTYCPTGDPISFENAIPLFPYGVDSCLHCVSFHWLWVDANGFLFTTINSYGCADAMEFFYSRFEYEAHVPGRENAKRAGYSQLQEMIQMGMNCARNWKGFDENILRSYQGMTHQNWKEYARPYPPYRSRQE